MKNVKAPSEDEIESELYKYAGEILHHRLLKFFNDTIKTGSDTRGMEKMYVLPLF
jgi:hypothetical protein